MRPCRVLAVVALLLGVLATIQPAQATSPAFFDTWSEVSLPLPNGAVAYDASRGVVLVGVAGDVPVLGSHLVELDPQTGAIGRRVALGSTPTVIAVSDDGSRAYAGYDGAAFMTEVDLVDFRVVRTIPLGSGSGGVWFAEDIEVQPGRADVVAVTRRNARRSPRFEGLVIYEAGVARPNVVFDHLGPTRIAFGSRPDVLYGYNNETSSFGLFTMAVDDDGVTVAVEHRRKIQGFDLEIQAAGDVVTASNGQVADPATGQILGSYGRKGAFTLGGPDGSTYFLFGATLSRHDAATFVQEGARAVGISVARQLVAAGSTLVAATPSSVVLLGPGVSGSGFSLPEGQASALRLDRVASVALDAVAMTAGPDDLVYAVTSAEDAQPFELVEVDTRTGERLRHVHVGASPTTVALSGDGSTLMVGHATADHLTEVDAATFEVLRTVQLPGSRGGPTSAAEMVGVPGGTGFVVELRSECCAPGHHEGVAHVVDGIVLPEITPDHSGPRTLAFAGPGDRTLYGFNSRSSAFTFYEMAVSDDGVEWVVTTRGVLDDYNLRIRGAGGTIYASDGTVVDPTVPLPIGQFAAEGIPVPVANRNRVFHVGGDVIHESLAGDRSRVLVHHDLVPGSARDALSTGRTLVVAGDGQTVLLPIRSWPRPPDTLAGERGDRRVRLDWSPPPDDGGEPVLGYRISRDGEVIAVVAPTNTTYLDDGLVNGRRYRYEVSAFNVLGDSAPSDGIVARPHPAEYRGHPYRDVPRWVDPAVRWAASQGLRTVLPPPRLRAGEPLSRGQAVRLLHRTSGSPEVGVDHGVTGVPPGMDAAVRWAVHSGHLTGYPDGSFRPRATMSRGEGIRLLYRFAGSPDVPTDDHVRRFDYVPRWLRDSVRWAAHDPAGEAPPVIAGLSPIHFGLDEGMTRAQFLRMLHRVHVWH